MTVFSSLRQNFYSTPSKILKLNWQVGGQVLKRHGGHGPRTFEIAPSSWIDRKVKDLCHLYTWVAIFLYGPIILYANVFVGPATLAEIPEGYIPKHWEYYRHPITRFLMRYIYGNPQKYYEIFLHYLYVEDEMKKLKDLGDQIDQVMKKRRDYKAYYYQPVTIVPNAIREEAEEVIPLVFSTEHLSMSGFGVNVGRKDTDISSEFSDIPDGVED